MHADLPLGHDIQLSAPLAVTLARSFSTKKVAKVIGDAQNQIHSRDGDYTKYGVRSCSRDSDGNMYSDCPCPMVGDYTLYGDRPMDGK